MAKKKNHPIIETSLNKARTGISGLDEITGGGLPNSLLPGGDHGQDTVAHLGQDALQAGGDDAVVFGDQNALRGRRLCHGVISSFAAGR